MLEDDIKEGESAGDSPNRKKIRWGLVKKYKKKKKKKKKNYKLRDREQHHHLHTKQIRKDVRYKDYTHTTHIRWFISSVSKSCGSLLFTHPSRSFISLESYASDWQAGISGTDGRNENHKKSSEETKKWQSQKEQKKYIKSGGERERCQNGRAPGPGQKIRSETRGKKREYKLKENEQEREWKDKTRFLEDNKRQELDWRHDRNGVNSQEEVCVEQVGVCV